MTEICQVQGDIPYLSQRKQNFMKHLKTFHYFYDLPLLKILLLIHTILRLLIIH